MGFMARGSQTGPSRASSSGSKRRRRTGDGDPKLAWVEKQVAVMKKKLEELCVLCGIDGFLIYESAELGFRTHWPGDQESCLSLIQRFRDCQEDGKKRVKYEGVSVLLKDKVGKFESYFKGFQERNEERRLGGLLRSVCGESSLDGLGLGDLEKVSGRISSEVRRVIGLLQKRSNPQHERSIGIGKTEKDVLESSQSGISAELEQDSLGGLGNEFLDMGILEVGDLIQDSEEIMSLSSSSSSMIADGWGLDEGLEDMVELQNGCLREWACEFMDLGFLELGDLIGDVQNKGEINVETRTSYLDNPFCDDDTDMGNIGIRFLMDDFEEEVQDQEMVLERQEESLIDKLCDYSDVGLLQKADVDDKAENKKDASVMEEDSSSDDSYSQCMDLGLFYTEEDFSSDWSGTEFTYDHHRHNLSPLTFWD